MELQIVLPILSLLQEILPKLAESKVDTTLISEAASDFLTLPAFPQFIPAIQQAWKLHHTATRVKNLVLRKGPKQKRLKTVAIKPEMRGTLRTRVRPLALQKQDTGLASKQADPNRIISIWRADHKRNRSRFVNVNSEFKAPELTPMSSKMTLTALGDEVQGHFTEERALVAINQDLSSAKDAAMWISTRIDPTTLPGQTALQMCLFGKRPDLLPYMVKEPAGLVAIIRCAEERDLPRSIWESAILSTWRALTRCSLSPQLALLLLLKAPCTVDDVLGIIEACRTEDGVHCSLGALSQQDLVSILMTYPEPVISRKLFPLIAKLVFPSLDAARLDDIVRTAAFDGIDLGLHELAAGREPQTRGLLTKTQTVLTLVSAVRPLSMAPAELNKAALSGPHPFLIELLSSKHGYRGLTFGLQALCASDQVDAILSELQGIKIAYKWQSRLYLEAATTLLIRYRASDEAFASISSKMFPILESGPNLSPQQCSRLIESVAFVPKASIETSLLSAFSRKHAFCLVDTIARIPVWVFRTALNAMQSEAVTGVLLALEASITARPEHRTALLPLSRLVSNLPLEAARMLNMKLMN
eukprot:gnl/Dysnectes_brevis/4094_a5368_409.p1 GENE.gnl/Dysnectes_brevis/4094_a5368_409~~gnl/Dysnectes_brevis/4094_a5368_409.p1  ORF type:complete len:658 (+),score=87.62 gnl/Dysnectes_brevis/4094_a5368_409:214-1974(+)